MAAPSIISRRRDWKTAFRAMGKLIADPNDTVQVFHIMRSLNADVVAKNYHRLLQTPEGGRLAYARLELLTRLMDRDFLARFAPGTVGATYRAFIERTGYSAAGLADVGEEAHGSGSSDVAHPYAWFGRRERDIHDIWHVLTGYQADDPLGELCLVAFTYAQTGGLGWGFIALMGALRSLREPGGRLVRRAAWEGYAHGKAASWLHNEDYEALFAEPLEAARARLNIGKPVCYQRAKQAIGAPVAQPHAVAAE